MAIHNRKHLQVKASQKRITFAEFAVIQGELGLSNVDVALLSGLSLSFIETTNGKYRENDLCSSSVSATILLLKFLAEKAPGTFSRVKDDFHAWAFAYKAE